jgi:hypothetical protein
MTDQPISLILPNIAEFNLRNPAFRPDPAVEQRLAAVGSALADQAVFWDDGSRVLVLPAGLDRQWFADVHEVLGIAEPPVVSPAPRSGFLVRDLLHDGVALAEVRAALAGRETVRLKCWAPACTG